MKMFYLIFLLFYTILAIDVSYIDQISISSASNTSFNDEMELFLIRPLPSDILSALLLLGPINHDAKELASDMRYVYSIKLANQTLEPMDVGLTSEGVGYSLVGPPAEIFASNAPGNVSPGWQILVRPGPNSPTPASLSFSKNVSVIPVMNFTTRWSSPFTLFRTASIFGRVLLDPPTLNQTVLRVRRTGSTCPLSLTFGCDRLPDTSFPADYSIDLTGAEAYFVVPVPEEQCLSLFVYLNSKQDCDRTALAFDRQTSADLQLDYYYKPGQVIDSVVANTGVWYYRMELPNNTTLYSVRIFARNLPQQGYFLGPEFSIAEGQPWNHVSHAMTINLGSPLCKQNQVNNCTVHAEVVVQNPVVYISFDTSFLSYDNMAFWFEVGGVAVPQDQPVVLFQRNVAYPPSDSSTSPNSVQLVSHQDRAFCFYYDSSVVGLTNTTSIFPFMQPDVWTQQQPFCAVNPPGLQRKLSVTAALQWPAKPEYHTHNTTISPIIPVLHQLSGSGNFSIANDSWVVVDWQPSAPGSMVELSLNGPCEFDIMVTHSVSAQENDVSSSLQYFETSFPCTIYTSPFSRAGLSVWTYFGVDNWAGCTVQFKELRAQLWEGGTVLQCQRRANGLCGALIQFGRADPSSAAVLFTQFNDTVKSVNAVAARNPRISLGQLDQPKYMFLKNNAAWAVAQQFTDVREFEVIALGERAGLNSTTFSAWVEWVDDGRTINIKSVISRVPKQIVVTGAATSLTVAGPAFYQFHAPPSIRLLNFQIQQPTVNRSSSGPPSGTSPVYNGWNGFSTGLRGDWFPPVSIRNQIGMNWWPRSNFVYRPNSKPYWFYVPNNLTVELILTPRKTKQLCSPSLQCSGNGLCTDDAIGCNCFSGILYHFSAPRCQDKGVSLWALILILFTCSLLFFYLIWFMRSRRARRMSSIGRGNGYGETTTAEATTQSTDEVALLDLNQPDSTLVCLLDTSVVLASGQALLQDVSLRIHPGVTLFLGASGSGKSSLIRLLAGKLEPTSGRRICTAKKIAFVPQVDVLPPFLTVREAVVTSAMMRLPSAWSNSRKLAVADNVISRLRIDHRQNVLIGTLNESNLSGGERKRCSCAVELAALPQVLFLDEPTSGLDSAMTMSFMELLKNGVASMGIRIVAVLHQPRQEIFETCVDRLVVLRRGQVVFDDTPAAVQAPPNANVGDYLLDNVGQLSVLSDLSDDDVPLTTHHQTVPVRGAGFFRQLSLQIAVTFRSQIRNIAFIAITYVLTAVSALMVGLMFKNSVFEGAPDALDVMQCPDRFRALCGRNREDNLLSQANIIALAVGLVAASSSLSVFGGEEKPVFWRFASAPGFSVFAYFLSKLVVEFVNVVLPSLMFVAIFSSLTSPPIDFFLFWALTAGVNYSCSGAGYVLGQWADDSRAIVGVVVFVAICSLFGGVAPTIDDVKDQLGPVLGSALLACSYARWAIQAFYSGIMVQYSQTYNVQAQMNALAYSIDDRWFATANLFVIGAVLRVLAFFSLLLANKSKRK